MEPYESDTEGEDQETLLLPRGHEVKFPKAHKGIFCWFVSCSRLLKKTFRLLAAKKKCLHASVGMQFGEIFVCVEGWNSWFEACLNSASVYTSTEFLPSS